MIATTPIATAVFSITSPFGRSTRRSTFPTGSGSSATSLIPCAMPLILLLDRASRSNITSEIIPLDASRSFSFSAKISSVPAINSSAMARSAAFFLSVSANIMEVFASFASFNISCVVILLPLFLSNEFCSNCFAIYDFV